MTKLSSCSESGVILPLFAVSILGILVYFLVMAVDLPMFNRSNAIAQSIADKSCLSLINAKQVALSHRALQVAAAQLPTDSALGNGLTLSRVRLTVPVTVTDLTDSTSPIAAPFTNADTAPLAFSDLGLTCPTGVTCEVVGNVVDSNFAAGEPFPNNLISVPEHNSLIACEVEVESNPVWLSNPELGKGKAVVGLEHSGKERLLAVASSNPGYSTIPSFIIGISPHAATPASALPNTPYAFSASFSQWDPHTRPGTFNNPNPDPVTTLRMLYGAYYPDLGFAAPSFANTPLFANGSANDVQRTEMRTGCYGPFIAARNLFIQTLLEIISRVGEINKTSQVLMVSTKHDSPVADNNPPILMKRSRMDPASQLSMPLAERFVLPFMNHRATQPEGTNYFCPFSDIPAECSAGERALMSQLRNCFHVHTQPIGLRGTVNTVGYTDALEPANPPPYDYSSDDALLTLAPNPPSWGQMTIGGSGLPETRKSLKDVIRVMGTVQSCPYEDSHIAHEPTVCDKPATPDLTQVDLEPDIVGFLRYARGDLSAHTELGKIWHPDQGDDLAGVVPNMDTTFANQRHPSDVVLILSQRLEPGSVGAIGTEVDQLNALGLRVIVIFFARDADDQGSPGSDTTMSNLQTAFRAGGGSVVTPSQNVVIRVAPSNDITGCTGANDSQPCFSAFYHELLSLGGARSSQRLAEYVIDTHMLNTRPLL